MFHQILACLTALVADLDRAVRAELQKQLRVADTAAGDDDALCGIEIQLLRDACTRCAVNQFAKSGVREIRTLRSVGAGGG